MQNQILEKNNTFFKKYLDFDKENDILYDNIYMKEHKMVIKIPLFALNETDFKFKLKFEDFNLEDYNYLLTYE